MSMEIGTGIGAGNAEVVQMMSKQTINGEQQIYNQIKSAGSQKEQLKKVANEFESLFVTKMLTIMDSTVDKSGGIFGEKQPYLDTFKSFVFQEMGRDISNNPRTSIGMAQQIYNQMERYVN